MANLTLRSVKGSPLTNAELDGNFEYFTGSHAVTGSITVTENLIVSGSIIGNISGSVLITNNNGVQITGSLIISGSNTFTNIGPAVFSGSVTSTGGFTGSLSGTATTASYISPTFISASAAAAGFGSGGGSTINTGSFATTGSNIFNGNQTITGSVTSTGGFTGSLLGTATSATTSTTATSASYAATASVLLGGVVSASYALTASYVLPTSPVSVLVAVDGIGSNFVSSSLNTYKEYLIPANTLTTSSILEVEAGITKDTSNGLTNVYFSISSSISETTIAFVSINASSTYSPLWRNFAISGSSIIYLNTATSLATDASATNASILTTSINTTIDNYLKIYAFTPASNSVSRLSYCRITAHK